jgi:RimJ/RimL family protein N-acetyltransferase
MTTDCQTRRLTFSRFDEGFLEKSWRWLQDPEIKKLTMTPDFNHEQQRRWFDRLPEMKDYFIWGLRCDGAPIGAVGLKHVADGRAEYWGYIGERGYWGAGLGGEMMRFIFGEAKKMRLRELYLVVHHENTRAMALYQKHGFRTVAENAGVLRMELRLGDSHE